jgi:O-antigen/teichoic acid export membrane protein
MAFGTLFNFAAIAYLMGLLAAHRDRAYLASLGAAAAASVVGGLLLVPTLGLLGATVVVSLLDFLAWSVTLRTHWRLSGTLFLHEWVRPVVAALLVAAWLLLGSALGITFVPRAAIGGVFYLGLVFIQPSTGAVVRR